jgi:outer membrane protein
VAKDQTRAVRSQHAPVVTLVASNLYSDQGYDSRLQPPYRVDTLGVQVTMPIYEGGRVDASVREAIARLEIADQQYEESRREVIRQVRTDHVHVAASRARIESTGRELESRQRGVEALERGYQLGVSTIVAVLDARKLMLKADSDHHSARYDLIRDRVALRVHSGNLDEESVRETSTWFGGADGVGSTSRN